MLILGIESSCDESAAAVVRAGREVLSNVINSQIDHHSRYGGVVPEIASRCHVAALPGVIREAMDAAGVAWSDIDAIAATRGPGLSTSLLVGYAAAKSLSLRLGRPLIPVNHLEGHLFSIFLGDSIIRPSTDLPVLTLLVSGGHSCLVLYRGPGDMTVLGETRDDAAGEALDKGSMLLGLGYPGGPAIEKMSAGGNLSFVRFPRGLKGRSAAEAGLDFSFSGLKTSLLYHLKRDPLQPNDPRLPHLAASYQEAVVDALVLRVDRALDERVVAAIGCGGGVARNRRLRERLGALARSRNLELLLAPPDFCTDNAAMIAALAANLPDHLRGGGELLDIEPDLPLMEPA